MQESVEGLKVKSLRMQEGWNKRRQGWGNRRCTDRRSDGGCSSRVVLYRVIQEKHGCQQLGGVQVHQVDPQEEIYPTKRE